VEVIVATVAMVANAVMRIPGAMWPRRQFRGELASACQRGRSDLDRQGRHTHGEHGLTDSQRHVRQPGYEDEDAGAEGVGEEDQGLQCAAG
jgi:hypothetical protein